ncbi:MAG TPA: adenosylcobinamide-GDP ribazoletransferase [Gammaproteobacteria bacterium]|nr:adenosylcobinamide-GDP ribazoletransferase [Gammaproteobacteria bacterium]
MPTPLLIALQLLTRLPVRTQYPSARQTGYSLLYYPLIGFFIGAVLCLISALLPTQSTLLLAALILLVWTLITGGLHLDGLADSADAWIGGFGDREKTLRIMKDPACGPIAVAVLVLILLIKFSALQVALEQSVLAAVLISPIMARAAVIALYLTTPYAKDEGMGLLLIENLPKKTAVVVLVMTAGLCLLGSGALALMMLTTATVTFWLLRKLMCTRIGGVTGDTTGALIEITETTTLVAAALLM